MIYQVFNGYFTRKSLASWRQRQNIQLRVVRALWPILFKAKKRTFMITKNALKCTFPLLLKLKILMPAEATPKPFLKQSLPPFTEWRKSAILISIHNMQTDLCNFLKTKTAYADNIKHNNRARGNNVSLSGVSHLATL